MGGDNGAIVGGYSYPYYFQNNNAGEPTAVTVNGSIIYVTTSGGFIAAISKNQLTQPKTSGISLGTPPNNISVDIRDVKVVGKYIYLLVNDPSYQSLYTLILDSDLNYVKGFGWSIGGETLKGVYLDVKGDWLIVSAVETGNNAILIAHDLTGQLKDRYFNLTMGDALKLTLTNTFAGIYDESTGLIYVAVPLMNADTGAPSGTAIIAIDPVGGTITGSVALNKSGNTIQLNRVEAAANGYLYATGTYTIGKGYPDLLLVELNFDQSADPPFTVTGSWRIHGDVEEYTNNSHQAVVGNYIYMGGFTNSFSDSNDFSTMVVLASPSLQVDRDYYEWDKPPSISSPTDGTYVNSSLIDIESYTDVGAITSIDNLLGPTVTIATGSLSAAAIYTPVTHVGYTVSTPTPVPEPLFIAMILVAVFIASYVLFNKKH